MSHRRYNPLLDEWILCSPGRLKRPWLGQSDVPAAEEVPVHDPECYMCPGNVRASGERNPDYSGVFLFDNDYPALAGEGSASEPSWEPHLKDAPLLRSAPARGRCRVVCFSPRHDTHLGSMMPDALRSVVDAWAEESERLTVDEDAGYVQVFENRGPMMGASNPHPHGQIWATGHVPSIPAKKAHQQREYWSSHGTDLLGDYLDEEARLDERVVDANDHWVLVVPFWAVWPFETMLVPRRRVDTLADLDDEERDALAHVTRGLVRRYDALFSTPFPYSMGWYQTPRDGEPHPGSRLHAVYLPPLVRSASVKKFLVGYELTSEPQRDITAEQACEELKALSTS